MSTPHETDRIRESLPTLSQDKLLETRSYIQHALDKIKTQIARAKARYLDTGVPTEQTWWVSVHVARSHWRRLDQDICFELSRRRAERQVSDDRARERFVRLASRILGEVSFAALAEMAQFSPELVKSYSRAERPVAVEA